MNIIVTSNKVEYANFMKVKTLQEVFGIVGSIDFLVYHKSSETQEQKVDCLTRLKDKAKKLVYVRDKSSLEQAVQMIVVGSEGKYIDDEFFLENSEELNRLVLNLDEVTDIVQLGGEPVLNDFFNRYLKEGSSGFNSSYLAVVKEAVQNMLADYRQKDMQLIQMSTTATEIFTNTAEIISKVKTEQQRMKEAISQLEEAKESGDLGKVASFSGIPSVVFFPIVSYMKERNIIRIKDVGGSSFLTSFMLGFREYLEDIKYVRPKLIFIEPVGKQSETQYQEYNWVTQQTQKSMAGYYNSVVFTNYPSKEVLSKLLDDMNYDTFIVVDRLKTSKDHILNSKGCSVRYAVNGNSVVKKFNLKVSDCFSSIKEINGDLFTIPVFQDYPEDRSKRIDIYLRNCKLFYETLYVVRRR